MTTRLDPVLQELRRAAPELRRRGVVHAGVFGSVARGDERPDSDIDILLDLDIARVGDVLDYIGLTDSIRTLVAERLPGTRIDIADRAMLKPRLKAAVERDAVYAF